MFLIFFVFLHSFCALASWDASSWQLSATQVFSGESSGSVKCPSGPVEQELFRQGMIYSLQYDYWNYANTPNFKKFMKRCGILENPPACLKKVRDFANEHDRHVAIDTEGKYTSLPKGLDKPEFHKFIKSSNLDLSELRDWINDPKNKTGCTSEQGRASILGANKGSFERLFVLCKKDQGLVKLLAVESGIEDPIQVFLNWLNENRNNVSVIAIDPQKKKAWIRDLYAGAVTPENPPDCHFCHQSPVISLNKDHFNLVDIDGPAAKKRAQYLIKETRKLSGMGAQLVLADGKTRNTWNMGAEYGVSEGENMSATVQKTCLQHIDSEIDNQYTKGSPEEIVARDLVKSEISQQVRCARCHTVAGGDAHPMYYPTGLLSKVRQQVISGQMPAAHKTILPRDSRQQIVTCANLDMYGFDPHTGTHTGKTEIESMKNGRFYKNLARVPCQEPAASQSPIRGTP